MAVSRKGRIEHGQQFDPHSQVGPIPYTRQMQDYESADALVGQDNTEIQPIDAANSEVTIFDVAAIAAILDETSFVFADFVNFQLPDVLTGITTSFNISEGDGEHIQDAGDASSAGTSGGLALNPQSSAEGSAAIMPDAQPIIKQFSGQDVPAKRFSFYLPGSSITQAAILTKMAAIEAGTYLIWPVWKPESVVLSLKGQQLSLSQSASSHHSDQWATISTGTNLSSSVFPTSGRSDGFSKSGSVTTRTMFIPPTLHGSITLDPTDQTASTTTTVKANIPAITGTGSAPSFTAVTNEPDPITASAEGSISPTSISATSPATIPTSGIYVRDIRVEFYGWNYSFVSAVAVDFSHYA